MSTAGDDPVTGPFGADPDRWGRAAIVCFSHLRWDWVWQRPQHLLSRLAQDIPVYVVEEPIPCDAGDAGLQVRQDGRITVVTPRLPEPVVGFGADGNARIAALLGPFLADHLPSTDSTILWYYTPMALGAEPEGLQAALTVYDAMDDLASFRGASAAMRAREAELMARADLVFTGGPSLYAARKDRHPAVHCLPSGVEPAHFAQAANGIARPADLAGRRRPIIGFYGVIDERLDLDLVAAMADSRPDWTLALIGPVAKIAEDDLPRRPNIVHIGQRPYAELPGYLACFDVAILPFAINEATRSISPTKTLEYLAGQKPVVSTPIQDVVDLYGSAVEIAATPEAFVAAAERLLDEDSTARAGRLARSRVLVTRGDWDTIATRMKCLITTALTKQPEPAELVGAGMRRVASR